MESGTRLGPYEILEPLGKGGMGEVYRARDARLERDVAIKILPPELSADPGRNARMEREARLLAQLDHPNIATIHGIEETDIAETDFSVRLLVTQLVEGETPLADRLVAGPLPPEDALPRAQQIAGGPVQMTAAVEVIGPQRLREACQRPPVSTPG